MTNRWSTLRIDEASVMHLGVIDTPTLGRHADALASRRPSPRELFQRWDTQQWKIADIELEKDILDFHKRVREGSEISAYSVATSTRYARFTGC